MVPLEVTKHRVFQKGNQVCSLVIPGIFMFFSAPGKVSLSGVTMTGQVASKAGHKIFVMAFSPSPPEPWNRKHSYIAESQEKCKEKHDFRKNKPSHTPDKRLVELIATFLYCFH